MKSASISRADVWFVALDPATGSEQSKTRPCVVVQRDAANATSPTIIVCPLTSARTGGNVLNVLVRPREGGLSKMSIVLCNQVRAVDRARFLNERPLGRLSAQTMALVDEGLRVILDLGDG